LGAANIEGMGKGCIRVEDADGEDRDPVWVTPDSSRMPHCKICNAQGCMHFRRGYAHLLALNLVCAQLVRNRTPLLDSGPCVGWSLKARVHEGERERVLECQELNNRMCCRNIESERRTHYFLLHARQSPLTWFGVRETVCRGNIS
jgi:hypothetical protein